MKEIKVYIASPYTNGWMPTNVRRQFKCADELLELDYFPYVPLLTHFMELYSHREEHKWLELDFVFLKTCDAVLRLKPTNGDGKEIPSPGADMEEKLANENGIPVFYSVEDLNDYFKTNHTQGKMPIFDEEFLKQKYSDLTSDV